MRRPAALALFLAACAADERAGTPTGGGGKADGIGAACHPAIADDIRACVVDQQSDPENWALSTVETIERCADAEPVADAFDAVCGSTRPPAFCDSFEDFVAEVLPVCARELVDESLDQTCVLGTTYREILDRPVLHVAPRIQITDAAGLSALERAQVVLAVQASSHTDVTTAEEALERVDQHEINQLEVWDATARRGFTVYEYGVGDNSYGRVFESATVDTAALIHDGDLLECDVMFGDELRDCRSDDECRGALTCVGIPEVLPRGRCVDLLADDSPAIESACSAASACEPGLLCGGLSRGDEGVCLPAWQRRPFAVRADQAIPDDGAAGAASQVLVRGLAERDVDVWLRVAIEHPRPADLALSLIDPSGTEVAVPLDGALWEGGIDLDAAVLGFAGDGPVNGVWQLRAVDGAAGEAGTLIDWRLTVGSRW